MVRYETIDDFPGYRFGNDGSVWSCWKQRRKKGARRGFEKYQSDEFKKLNQFKVHNYLQVNLARPGKRFLAIRVHKLIMLAFVGPCPDGMTICHNNGDGTDNRLSNLRYDTKEANELDKRRHGTHVRGERHGQSVLTEGTVLEIKRRIALGESQRSIARELGIKQNRVSSVATGRDWEWVE